ncbi:MAG TPA: hypothetical protein PLT91_05495 [Clostridia bacterium]|jgi:hypothetical protein|nr:MAG: hypothetical protein BWX97_00577 [Firmicutes bacterium ADurb.Bin146]HOD93425.1 hypothetical protein [Clostridia bacterium]HQM39675.1 hypothetical protein [Clostridia bacterium]
MRSINNEAATALIMERNFLTRKADIDEYISLYHDTQPGLNVYWNGFGQPPSITFRTDFDDIDFNKHRQANRELIKGRFQGGNLGWIEADQIELFACAYKKDITNMTYPQTMMLELFKHVGPLNIHQMKEETKMLVKDITPVLHSLQQAFLIFEDQYDGEWYRSWYLFEEMFPDADLNRYTRAESIKILIQRFTYRNVLVNEDMIKSFYKFGKKDIATALNEMVKDNILTKYDNGYILSEDIPYLEKSKPDKIKSIYVMHRNDFLVKSNEYWLKEKFKSAEYETLQYLLINGQFKGATFGKFRYGPNDLEDIVLDMDDKTATERKDEILQAIADIRHDKKPLRYMGKLV